MITFWHNPHCSKSRATLALLEERGVAVSVRHYLEDAPSDSELRAAHTLLGEPVITMLRSGEAEFAAAGLTQSSSDDALFAAMAAQPKLIERPLVMTQTRAIIARPPEKVLDLL